MLDLIVSKHFKEEFDEAEFFCNDTWCDILKSHGGDYDINYTIKMQSYYCEYYLGSKSLSITYAKDGKSIFFLPMFLYQRRGVYVVSTDGEYLFEPLYMKGVPVSYQKRLNKKIFIFINKLFKELGVLEYHCIAKSSNLSLWHELVLNHAYDEFSVFSYGVDIRAPESEIRSHFRKSYRPLASKALKLWKYSVHDRCTSEMIQKFRELHLSVSGRITRSEKSWLIQAEQINAGEGFLVFIDNDIETIGAALFLHSKTMATYAVAAYKREFFEFPIGHGVQLIAIEQLKKIGVKDYLLGSVNAPWVNFITDKERAIEDFKKGFSTYTKVDTVFRLRVLD
ncbi:hypothetical protein [Thiopseudomonas acetoxidans]|uniref:BioF2-like acetyltransferase domain-containing protein n=1 Tax=Thiopseudomonas acetoxidans TaxID=3041622 RepID=A0ABT7SS26_9GAMM|nr:hypothetical protein [Thiopseudomonas sp. CY1220]MDM7858935.1 hypothetical protein [Thiopseudomonas sp. CY1220]